MKKLVLITVVSGFLLNNLIWMVLYSRLETGNDYHEAEGCAYRNYKYLNNLFKKGITTNRAFNIIDSEKLKNDGLNKDTGKEFITVYPEPDCTGSGRPYCGYDIVFKNKKLIEIIDNYPCH